MGMRNSGRDKTIKICSGDVEPGRLGKGEQENGALQTVRLKRRRNNDVRIYNQPKRKH